MIHRLAGSLFVFSVAACVPPRAVPSVALAPRAAIDTTGTQIRIQLSATPQEAAGLVVAALVERGISVTSNQGGVIEAKLASEMGFTATYEIVVRAYIAPDSTGSRVLLFGEETRNSARYGLATNRIGAFNQGRALATWKKLEAIGRELGAKP